MLLVELDWLPDAEFLGRIGRDALAVVLERLAPVLVRQGVALPDAGLPDALYFPKLAAVLRTQPIKLASRRHGVVWNINRPKEPPSHRRENFSPHIG